MKIHRALFLGACLVPSLAVAQENPDLEYSVGIGARHSGLGIGLDYRMYKSLNLSAAVGSRRGGSWNIGLNYLFSGKSENISYRMGVHYGKVEEVECDRCPDSRLDETFNLPFAGASVIYHDWEIGYYMIDTSKYEDFLEKANNYGVHFGNMSDRIFSVAYNF